MENWHDALHTKGNRFEDIPVDIFGIRVTWGHLMQIWCVNGPALGEKQEITDSIFRLVARRISAVHAKC